MPIAYARRLTGRHRTADANRHLGYTLAGVAGAINAGGFLAVQQYTSHMTGVVSAMADQWALGSRELVWGGLGALLSFVAGAACSAWMVSRARRWALHSEYALPLLLEAALLLCFGLLGARLSQIHGLFVPVTVMLLCFIMGLQNAVITKLSRTEIRTTHVTGIVTDIGIELGKWADRLGDPTPDPAAQSGPRLTVLATLLLAFFGGGVLGAWGFTHLGYVSTLPLALVLVTLAIVPALDDLRAWHQRGR